MLQANHPFNIANKADMKGFTDMIIINYEAQ
jgi:hypothetical protein